MNRKFIRKNCIYLKQKYYKSLPVLFDQLNACLLNQTINFFKINNLLISYCYILHFYHLHLKSAINLSLLLLSTNLLFLHCYMLLINDDG